MRAARGLVVHLVLLGVAGGLALRAFARGEKPPAAEAEQVQVWGGHPSNLKSLSFEALQDLEKRRVSIEVRKDSQGRWYIGTIEKQIQQLPGADAGAPLASSAPPKPQSKRETTQFVSVKEGEKLAESIAPLKALRDIGKVEGKKLADFGLDKPDANVRVVFEDGTKNLVIGGLTPSGSDRYARVTESGEVYALPGDFVRMLMFADSRLIERELHDFEQGEVTRVKITRGNAPPRELVRMKEKVEGWADAKTPTKLDETAGNWMAKVERLTANQYFEQVGVPVIPEYQIVKIEYFHDSKQVGFLELTKIPEAKSNAGYIAKTEHTRWYAQLLKSSAEQVEQDLKSVVK